ncbi:MerC domain-containing protein, partial [Spartinivicinus poritis]
MEKVINVQAIADKTAVGLSIVCMVHCLLLPIAMVTLPALSVVSLEDELFHQLLLIGVLPISIIALTIGCRKHKRWSNVFLGALGQPFQGDFLAAFKSLAVEIWGWIFIC